MSPTKIEWADETWNPLRARRRDGTGKVGWACVRVSPGCVNCYAATQNRTGWAGGTGLDYTVPDLAKVEPFLDEKVLALPSHWRNPRRVFVCSMTDVFGEWVGALDVGRLLNVAGSEPEHQFLFLTKRAERMRTVMAAYYETTRQKPLPNVWLGVSVEDQQRADERIPHLLATPAAVRFISAEPLLGPVNLKRVRVANADGYDHFYDALGGYSDMSRDNPTQVDRRDGWMGLAPGQIDWVICGGESGSRARPMDLAWARSIVEQCRAAAVPVFVKQLGAHPYTQAGDEHGWPLGTGFERRGDSLLIAKVRDRKGGDPEEWPEDLRIREWPL